MRSMQRSRTVVLDLAALFVTLMASSPVGAQSSTALLTGTVTDPTGAVMPGVQITITHLQTNHRAVVTTRADGTYLSTPLSVGDYRLEAMSNGFKAAVRTGITLEVNQTAVINVGLEVGAAAER